MKVLAVFLTLTSVALAGRLYSGGCNTPHCAGGPVLPITSGCTGVHCRQTTIECVGIHCGGGIGGSSSSSQQSHQSSSSHQITSGCSSGNCGGSKTVIVPVGPSCSGPGCGSPVVPVVSGCSGPGCGSPVVPVVSGCSGPGCGSPVVPVVSGCSGLGCGETVTKTTKTSHSVSSKEQSHSVTKGGLGSSHLTSGFSGGNQGSLSSGQGFRKSVGHVVVPVVGSGHSVGGSHGFSSSFKKSHSSRTHLGGGSHVVSPAVTVTKTCATCGSSHGSQSFSSFGSGSSHTSGGHLGGAGLCGGRPCGSSKPLGYGK